jgi:hypothetical protein
LNHRGKTWFLVSAVIPLVEARNDVLCGCTV